MQQATGQVNDISPLLTFYWWQPVYYLKREASFPQDTTEGRGHWVGIAEHVGHIMTYKILTDDTHKVIHRSNVRPVSSDAPNYHLTNITP